MNKPKLYIYWSYFAIKQNEIMISLMCFDFYLNTNVGKPEIY
jgi:hypothetical protein